MSKAKYAKAIKVVYTILMVLMLVSVANNVFAKATAPDPSTLTGTYGDSTEQVTNLGQQIIGIVSTVGIVASVIVLVILGIKYMMGSASEKAEYKKTMLPYLIGAILVFAASSIASIVKNVSAQFQATTGN